MPFFAPPAPSVRDLLNASSTAHARLTRVRAQITTQSTSGGRSQQTTTDLAVDGKTVLIRLRQPRQAGQDRSDRTFFLSGNRLVGYDSVAEERLSRTLPKGSNLDRLTFALGPVDELVRYLVQPSEIRTFYQGLAGQSGWQVFPGQGTIVLARQISTKAGTIRTAVALDTRTHLLRGLDAITPGNEYHWSVSYGNPGAVSFRVPTSARVVSAFTVAPEPPTYRSASAQKIARGMIAAYGRLRSGVVDVDGEEGHVKISLSGRKIREDRPNLSYAYDGKTLSIFVRKTGIVYRGASARGAIPDYVSDLGGRVDPFSRQIELGRVPFQELMRVQPTVSVAGQASGASGPCDILKLQDPRSRVTLFVRQRDRLVESASTDVFNLRGRTIASSTRRYRYSGIGQAPSVSWSLRSSKIRPLPKLKVRIAPRLSGGE